MPSPKPSSSIPLYYQSFFLWIEPLSALVGAYYAFFQQQTYLDLTHAPSAPLAGISLSSQIVLNQLANLYLLFAINEGLVLRATSDLGVWRTLLLGLLVADFGHLYSVSLVGPEIFWNVTRWNAMDWGNVGFVCVGACTRMAFLLGVGLPLRKRSKSS